MTRLLALLAAVVVSGGLAATALAATKSVTVGDDYFVRSSGTPTVSVESGTTVAWRFRGDSPHNVTVTSGPSRFRSSTMTSGSYRKTVRKTGRYAIVCTIHSGMDMTLRVRR